MKQVLLFSALVMLVAGCNLEGEPTLVIAPGTDVIIDGEKASVFGFDHCPKDEMAGLFGPFLSSHSCVVLNDDRQTVDVLVQFPTGATPERWKINTWISESGHRTVSLERPNGTFVAQGK